jgi:hypothetical protein
VSVTTLELVCRECRGTYEVPAALGASKRQLCPTCREVAAAIKRSKRPAERHSAVRRPLAAAAPRAGARVATKPLAGIREDSTGIEYVRVDVHINRPAHAQLVPMRCVVDPFGDERWEEAPAEDASTVMYWRAAA